MLTIPLPPEERPTGNTKQQIVVGGVSTPGMAGRLWQKVWPQDATKRHKIIVLGAALFVLLAILAVIILNWPHPAPSPVPPAQTPAKNQGQQAAPTGGNTTTPTNPQTPNKPPAINTPPGSSVGGGGSSGGTGTSPGTIVPSGNPGGGGATTPTNCVSQPSKCGYPDASNTGWQHTGVTLTVDNTDPFYITVPGTVVDSKDIRGCVFVMAENVTIKRSKITCGNQPMIKTYEPDGHGGLTDLAAGLLIEDVEFDGQGDPDSTGIAFNHYTVRRSNFHNIGSAVKLGTNDVLQDNYVHDIASTMSSHNGGFPSDGGSGVTITHNTILMNSTNGYAIALYNWIPAGTVVSDVTVTNNLLAGGNYVLYCGAPGHVTPNLQFTNNRFSKIFYDNGGFYGSSANCSDAANWANNFWDDSLAAVLP